MKGASAGPCGRSRGRAACRRARCGGPFRSRGTPDGCGRGPRIGRGQTHAAPALRPQQDDAAGKAVVIGFAEGLEIGGGAERRCGHQELDVRQAQIGTALEESGDAARQVGREAGAEQPGLSELAGDAVETHRAVKGAGLPPAIGHERGEMVLQIPARRRSARTRTAMSCARSSAGSPMPDNIKSCGELKTPAVSSTSRRARASDSARPAIFDADSPRPSKRIRVACAPTRIVSPCGRAPGGDKPRRRCSGGHRGWCIASGRNPPARRRCSPRSFFGRRRPASA